MTGHNVAPSLDDFEALVQSTYEGLPDRFRAMCGDLVIQVADFADDEVLAALNLQSPFDLLGLYQGVSLDQKSLLDVPQSPDMVFLYRRPILDYRTATGEALGAIVTHVLVHEIGHHFGLSDADMALIEGETS
ncbi:MAG: metallopeptidase family protein [Methyloligellaceae bacterium]